MHRHFKINKPYATLSQFTHRHAKRRNKRMLGEFYDFPAGTMAIGRLDEHSEGLLLLTTDGRVSERVRSAKLDKEYYVRVLGTLTPQTLARLSAGVDISLSGKPYRTKPCLVKSLPDPPEFSFPPRRVHRPNHGPATWLSIVLREGKNRQIRRMLATVGHPVIRLVRVRIGAVRLGTLAAGEVEELAERDFSRT